MNKWKKISISLVIIGLISVFAVGCAAPSTSTPSPTSPAPSSSQPSSEPPTSSSPTSKAFRIGVSVRDLSAPFIKALLTGIQKKADELGLEITTVSSNNDPQTDLSNMDNLLAMKVDGFICGSTIDPIAIIPGIKKFNAANIPVVATDNSPTGGKVDAYIAFDIADSSVKCANIMLDELKKRNNGQIPKGVIIEVMGDLLSDSWAGISTRAFHSVMDQYKDTLQIVQGNGNWNNDDAFRVVSDFSTRFKDQIVGVFVHTPDIMGTGAVNALKGAGLDPKKIISTGVCIGPEGLILLKNQEFTAMIEQPIEVSGEMAVDMMNKILTKQSLPKIGDKIEEQGAIWSPAEVLQNIWGADGLYIKLQGVAVPQEVAPTDPRLWENSLFGTATP